MLPEPDFSEEKPVPIADLTPIAAARRKLSLSLQDVARTALIDPAHLELIERQSALASPTLAELQRIASVLRLDVEILRRTPVV